MNHINTPTIPVPSRSGWSLSCLYCVALLVFVLLSCSSPDSGETAADGEQPYHSQSGDAEFMLAERPDIERSVSITIDDLPVGGQQTRGRANLPVREEITMNLLEKVVDARVPAVGFVNERNLFDPDFREEEMALLESWLDRDLELANHTYSHFRFDDTPLETFTSDILRGEEVTRPLMESYGMELRYFRHPFLNIGEDQARIDSLNQFLDDHNYIVAPVTVDSRDWYYNGAYENALNAGEQELADRIADDYIRHTEAVFRHSEYVTRNVLGWEPAQILLLHAIRLNADHFDRVAAIIQDLGYEFVTLEEALDDPLFLEEDTSHHPSTLNALNQRWEESTGEELPGSPLVPEWVSAVREMAAE